MTSLITSWYTAAMNSIFSEHFWLPANTTWYDFESTRPDVYYPTFKELWKLPVYIAVLFVIRYFIEMLIFRPIGRALGMKCIPTRRLVPNSHLEAFYLKEKRPDAKQVKKLASAGRLSERQVDRWFRVRRNCDKSSRLTKFTESGWRFTFYLVAQVYGIWVLWDKRWLVDQQKCWIGHPFQHVSNDVYWYYMLELSFYSSAVISIFIEVRRKDFWQMFIHHIATILLISFSWITNFIRIGTLIFLVHDVADPWMELAKLMKYSKKDFASIVAFVIFTTIWIVTRLYVYPKWLLYSVLFDTRALLQPFSSLRLFEALLLLLQALHVMWTVLILKIPYRMLVQGSQVNDSRSDSEMESVSCDEDNGTKINNNNTYTNGARTTNLRKKVE